MEETTTGRGAFALDIRTDGKLKVKGFPAMDPEMMWNVKYGHRARREEPSGEMIVALDKARSLAQSAVKPSGTITISEPKFFYGYCLFPIEEAGRLVGEAAVKGLNGRVVWRKFPEAASFYP